MKNCLLCKHFYLISGSPGYSEYTPGSDLVIGCDRNVWEFDSSMTSEDEFLGFMNTANTCDRYEPREVKDA